MTYAGSVSGEATERLLQMSYSCLENMFSLVHEDVFQLPTSGYFVKIHKTSQSFSDDHCFINSL